MGGRKYAGEVKSYDFVSFSDQTIKSETYSFKNFEITSLDQNLIAAEQGFAKNKGFDIGDEIKKQRGHAQYEIDQYNIKIAEEVEKRVQKLKSEVTRKSYEHAIKMAKNEIEDQFSKNFNQQVSDLTQFVDFVKEQQNAILNKSKKDVLKIIQLVVHWVIQKEVKIDYVENLLPLILSKVQENQKILVKVDAQTYGHLQNAENLLSNKFSIFKDIKVIMDEHITYPGVIVETDSNIFDASAEAQNQLIENLFSSLMESQSGSNSSEN